MTQKLFIGIDNGNKMTKSSEGFICESGFVKSDVEPISKQNLLIFNANYYSIGSSRLSVQMDKTVNDDAFIFSLAAIADAISKLEINSSETIEVIVAVGLPIIHYGKSKGKFREYFLRKDIKFNYNGSNYKINIVDCRVYPQGYAAFVRLFGDYKNVAVTNIIDIGGYTVDIFKVENGIINPAACYSLPLGIITLLSAIQQELLKSNINLSEGQIQDIIVGKEPVIFGLDVKETIINKSKEYIENLLNKIIEMGFELRNPNVFVGGGSVMLKDFIESSEKVKFAEHLDQFSNAKGYKILLQQELRR